MLLNHLFAMQTFLYGLNKMSVQRYIIFIYLYTSAPPPNFASELYTRNNPVFIYFALWKSIVQ